MNSMEITINHIGVDHTLWKEDFDAYLNLKIDSMVQELDKLEMNWCFDGFSFPVQFRIMSCAADDNFNHEDFILYIESKIDIAQYAIIQKKVIQESCLEQVKGINSFSDEDWFEFCKNDLGRNLEKRVYDTILAVNIAYPGCFEIANGKIKIDNNICVYIPRVYNNILFTYEDIFKKGWPNLENISIFETWKWLEAKTNYLDFVGNTAIDRALNAFSYSFNSNNYEELFYSLLGLEALYNTEHSNGIMEQIKEKAISIFGEPKDFKRDINRMYANRSAFVHGKMNFPGKFYFHDADTDFEKFISDDFEKTVFAAHGILISTFHKLIKNTASQLINSTVTTFN